MRWWSVGFIWLVACTPRGATEGDVVTQRYSGSTFEIWYDSGSIKIDLGGVSSAGVTVHSELYELVNGFLDPKASITVSSTYVSGPSNDILTVSQGVHGTYMSGTSGTKFFAEHVSASGSGHENGYWRFFKVAGGSITPRTRSQWEGEVYPVSSWVDSAGHRYFWTAGTEVSYSDTDSGGADLLISGATPVYTDTTTPGQSDVTDESSEN